jgi:hypothetical protein
MDSTRLGSLTMTARFLFTEAIAKRQMKRDKLLGMTVCLFVPFLGERNYAKGVASSSEGLNRSVRFYPGKGRTTKSTLKGVAYPLSPKSIEFSGLRRSWVRKPYRLVGLGRFHVPG